jgi:hypothetical protein
MGEQQEMSIKEEQEREADQKVEKEAIQENVKEAGQENEKEAGQEVEKKAGQEVEKMAGQDDEIGAVLGVEKGADQGVDKEAGQGVEKKAGQEDDKEAGEEDDHENMLNNVVHENGQDAALKDKMQDVAAQERMQNIAVQEKGDDVAVQKGNDGSQCLRGTAASPTAGSLRTPPLGLNSKTKMEAIQQEHDGSKHPNASTHPDKKSDQSEHSPSSNGLKESRFRLSPLEMSTPGESIAGKDDQDTRGNGSMPPHTDAATATKKKADKRRLPIEDFDDMLQHVGSWGRLETDFYLSFYLLKRHTKFFW